MDGSKKVVPVSAGLRRVIACGVLTVAAVAAAISYSHMRDLALDAGEGEWQAALLPLSVDGMMLVASMAALARRRAGMGPGFWPSSGFGLGVAASLGANVAAAEPTVTGRLVAAWPPLALLVAWEILAHGLPRTGPEPADPEPEPEPVEPVEPVPVETPPSAGAPSQPAAPPPAAEPPDPADPPPPPVSAVPKPVRATPRVEQLLPLAEEIATSHDGTLTRRALKDGLAARGETAGTEVLRALQTALASSNGKGVS